MMKIERSISGAKASLASKRKVYSGYKTKHFVPFISRHYFAKPIPTDEFRSGLMESTKRSQYILPIKLDDSEIAVEHLHRDTQYLKKDEYTPEQLAGALKYVVGRSIEPAKDIDKLLDDELNLPGPKITPRTYSKFEEAEELIRYIAEKFDKHLPKLRNEGYAPVVRKKDDSVHIMVERDGKTLFVLNIFFSSMGDNHIGFNFNQRSMMANANSENGNIEPVFDKELQKAGYLLNDYANFGSKDLHSKEQIVEFFWDKMNKDLEARFMIHIYVDYEGPRSDETNSYTCAGKEYLAKLDEIEAYDGKIDKIIISVGSDKAGDMWDQQPKQVLVDTTNVGIAVRER